MKRDAQKKQSGHEIHGVRAIICLTALVDYKFLSPEFRHCQAYSFTPPFNFKNIHRLVIV